MPSKILTCQRNIKHKCYDKVPRKAPLNTNKVDNIKKFARPKVLLNASSSLASLPVIRKLHRDIGYRGVDIKNVSTGQWALQDKCADTAPQNKNAELKRGKWSEHSYSFLIYFLNWLDNLLSNKF